VGASSAGTSLDAEGITHQGKLVGQSRQTARRAVAARAKNEGRNRPFSAPE